MELTNESLVPTFRNSGSTQKDFCEKHNISLVKLQYHLYRRGKRKSSGIGKESNKNNRQPDFITFNKTESPASVITEEIRREVTIIHGRFSAKELASLLLEMEGAC
jgi:hypothetical protein